MHLMVFFITSQNPFEDEGVSAYAKYGQTSQKLLVTIYTTIMAYVAKNSTNISKAAKATLLSLKVRFCNRL
jgi:hypothetical protein